MVRLQPVRPISVSILIVNYNGADYLPACLRALEAQTRPPDSILLVDNGSKDSSVPWARRQPGIDVMALGENVGFARANNLGVSACRTDWVALLNADAYPDPGWLEALLRAAEESPGTAAFGSRQLLDDRPEILDGIGDVYHGSGLVWREGHGRRQEERDLVAREIFSPCAAAALYRRATFLDVDGFDADFFCYCEDVDLGFRLRLAGHRARYVPDAVVRHVGSVSSGGRRSEFATFHGHRNLVWAFVKNMPGALFWLLLPFHLALNVWLTAGLILRGQGRVALAAKGAAIKGLPVMWRKRRRTQAARVVAVGEIWKALDKRMWKRSTKT